MKRSLVALSLALAFGLSVLATQVSAADSSGTYEGTIKCTTYSNNGTKVKTRESLTVMVHQVNPLDPVSNLRMDISVLDITLADGTQFDDANNPAAKAAIGAVSCNNNPEADTFNFVANLTLKKADASNGRAKLKGTAAFTDATENGTCKINVTRTSTDVPRVEPC